MYTLKQLLTAGKTLAQVTDMLHQGQVSQDTYEAYCDLWERSRKTQWPVST